MPEPNSGCWLWTGAAGGPREPYGKISNDEKHVIKAHRAAWILFRGQIPDGLWVLHKCDVTLCVNPDHLFLGTHADNMADMAEKGRAPYRRHPEMIKKGQAHGGAKLTEAQVAEIRSRPEIAARLAIKFGVTASLIRRIRSHKLWRHLP